MLCIYKVSFRLLLCDSTVITSLTYLTTYTAVILLNEVEEQSAKLWHAWTAGLIHPWNSTSSTPPVERTGDTVETPVLDQLDFVATDCNTTSCLAHPATLSTMTNCILVTLTAAAPVRPVCRHALTQVQSFLRQEWPVTDWTAWHGEHSGASSCVIIGVHIRSSYLRGIQLSRTIQRRDIAIHVRVWLHSNYLYIFIKVTDDIEVLSILSHVILHDVIIRIWHDILFDVTTVTRWLEVQGKLNNILLSLSKDVHANEDASNDQTGQQDYSRTNQDMLLLDSFTGWSIGCLMRLRCDDVGRCLHDCRFVSRLRHRESHTRADEKLDEVEVERRELVLTELCTGLWELNE